MIVFIIIIVCLLLVHKKMSYRDSSLCPNSICVVGTDDYINLSFTQMKNGKLNNIWDYFFILVIIV